jgi:hypothetical protein
VFVTPAQTEPLEQQLNEASANLEGAAASVNRME